MKVLITGSARFMGSAVVRLLVSELDKLRTELGWT